MFIAVDIKTQGRNYLKNSLISIDACVQSQDPFDEDIKLPFVKSVCDSESYFLNFHVNLFPENGKDFEEECYQSFWSKNLSTLELLQTNQISLNEGIKYLYEFIKKIESINNETTTIASDNVAFDIACLDYHFLTQIGKSLHYSFTDEKKYRPIIDLDSYQCGVFNRDISTDPWIDNLKILEEHNLTHNRNCSCSSMRMSNHYHLLKRIFL